MLHIMSFLHLHVSVMDWGESELTFSDWTALTVKEEYLLEGKSLSGEAERPLGDTKALVIEEVKLDLSWLAIGDAVAMTFARCSQ